MNEWTNHLGSLEELWEGLKSYTLDPIVEFMDSLNVDTIMFISSLWEIPMIKELLIAIVAVMVFGAIVIFLGGGI